MSQCAQSLECSELTSVFNYFQLSNPYCRYLCFSVCFERWVYCEMSGLQLSTCIAYVFNAILCDENIRFTLNNFSTYNNRCESKLIS